MRARAVPGGLTMTAHDPEAWLNLVRQALAPRDADQARVLAALEHKLSLPANNATASATRDVAQEPELNHVHATATSSVASPLEIPSTWLRWALGVIVPLTGVAAVSLFLTTPKSPVREPTPTLTAAVAQPSTLDPSSAHVEQDKKLDPSVAHVEQDKKLDAPTPESAPPAPKEKKPQRKKCRTRQGNERPCTTVKASETAVASAPPPGAAAPASSLRQELAALREAQRALREGQAARALAVLTAFEQTSAGPGAMREEREAAATMARCALAPRSAITQELYDDFARRYPKSAYAPRLERTCLPKAPKWHDDTR